MKKPRWVSSGASSFCTPTRNRDRSDPSRRRATDATRCPPAPTTCEELRRRTDCRHEQCSNSACSMKQVTTSPQMAHLWADSGHIVTTQQDDRDAPQGAMVRTWPQTGHKRPTCDPAAAGSLFLPMTWPESAHNEPTSGHREVRNWPRLPIQNSHGQPEPTKSPMLAHYVANM